MKIDFPLIPHFFSNKFKLIPGIKASLQTKEVHTVITVSKY